jgi:hypothetical protein
VVGHAILLFDEPHGFHGKIFFRQHLLLDLRIRFARVIGDFGRMIHGIRIGIDHALDFVEDRTYPQGRAFSGAVRNNKLDDTHMFRKVVIGGYTGEKTEHQ